MQNHYNETCTYTGIICIEDTIQWDHYQVYYTGILMYGVQPCVNVDLIGIAEFSVTVYLG